MFSWLLEVVNSGVIDNPITGGNQADGSHGFLSTEIIILLLIVAIIGFLLGFGLRSLIQIYKNAPNDNKTQERK